MGALAPWFLAGLAAVAVPLYVHLLRQHKSTPLPFSSLMFFEQRTQSSVKHRRLKYIGLLLLRILTIALVALMFAGFYVSCSGPASSRNRLTIVAVDRSLSMKAGSRMADAKRQAESVLAGLNGPGQVLSFDTHVNIVTQPVADKGALISAVQALDAGDGRSGYGTIARAIASIAQAARQPVEAHIFSDMQRNSLPSPFSELALPQNVKLVLHPLADKREPNWYVENVVAPRHVYGTGRVRIQATITGAGTEQADLNVALALEGRDVESRRVTVHPGGRATAEFFLSDVAHGFNRGHVRIDARDALAQDNSYPFAIERKETSHILFVGSERAALFYRAAVESIPEAGFSVETVSPGQAANIGLDKYALVVLSDPQSVPSALDDYVKKGGGVLISLGAASLSQPRVPVSGEKILESRYAAREGERFLSAGSTDASHIAVAHVNGFEGVKFYQAVRTDAAASRVLARLSDGSPLVTERRVGDGRVLVFASTFDNVANDLPIHPAFVPFVASTARYLTGFDIASPDYTVGAFVELRTAREAGTGVEIIGPDGRRELSLSEATRLPAFQLPREGFFELRRANGRHELIAAHADRRESDLDIIPAETLTLWQNTGAQNTSAPGAAQPGEERQELWRYFLIALLITALAESLFASRYLNAEPKPVAVRKQAA